MIALRSEILDGLANLADICIAGRTLLEAACPPSNVRSWIELAVADASERAIWVATTFEVAE